MKIVLKCLYIKTLLLIPCHLCGTSFKYWVEPSKVARGISTFDLIAQNTWYIEFHVDDLLKAKCFDSSNQLKRINHYVSLHYASFIYWFSFMLNV